MRGLVVVVALVSIGSSAWGQPVPLPVEPAVVPAEPAPVPDAVPEPAPPEVAAPPPAWATAPLSTDASGIERAVPTPFSHHLLWVPRVVLFVPRWAFWLAMQPLRLAAYGWERLHLGDRFDGMFFNTDQTVGLYPVIGFESGFGLNVGARFVHKDLFGAGERLKLRAGFGGRYSQIYSATLRSGRRFGRRVEAGLELRYERRPRERFFGIGNADQIVPDPAMPLIDPAMTDVAVDTRFREDLVRTVATLDVPVIGDVSAHLSGAFMRLRFDGVDTGRSLDTVYDASRLVGYDTGVTNVYVEGELRYDSRRQTSRYESQAVDATGWLASGFFGGATGLGTDRSDYFRYGGEIQRYIDLYRGSRVLALRVMVEATGGTNNGTGISFVDLPRLGGSEFLRGYPTDRFRDRAWTLASAEYLWSLGNYLAGYTFVDTGRVWSKLADVGFEDLRVGYGGGIQIHNRDRYLMRFQVALSRERDVFFEFALSPTFDRRERAGRF